MKTEATKEEEQNETSKPGKRKGKSSSRGSSVKSLNEQDKPENDTSTNTDPAEHAESSESNETTLSHDEPETVTQRRSIRSRKVKAETAKEEDSGLEPVKVGRRGRSKVNSNLTPETSNKVKGLRVRGKNESETETKPIDQTKKENDISISRPEPNAKKGRGKRGKSNEEKVEIAEDENIDPDKTTSLKSSIDWKSRRGGKSRINIQVEKEEEVEEEEKDLPMVSVSSRKRNKENDGNEDEIKRSDSGSKRRKGVSKKGNNSILTKLESKSQEDLKEESPVQAPSTENANGKRSVSSRKGRGNKTGENMTEPIEPAVELGSKRRGRKPETSLDTTNSTVDTSTRSSPGVSHPTPAPSKDTSTTSKTDKKRSKSKPVVQEISENPVEIKSQTPIFNDQTTSERKSVKRKMESNSSEIVRRPKLSKCSSPSEQVDHDASLCGSPALRRATLVKKYKVLFTGYFCEKENQIVLDLGKLLIS